MRVYVGYDRREHEAYRVAVDTLYETSGIVAECLDSDKLAAHGLLRRSVDMRDGKFYDLPSNASASTEFAVSRFLTPILCQSGWALFTDCDVVFLEDVHGLLDYADHSKAVVVVKHDYRAKEQTKMDGQLQTHYARKNWSSVMLFNCDHPANRRLTLADVNERPGRDLHAFYWLNDSEIGELPSEWNWLVNEQDKPAQPCIAHFTLGGPWIPNWTPSPHDEIWLEASEYI